jgi:hypothetical protein
MTYNSDIKNEYIKLSGFKLETKEILSYLFSKSGEIERSLDKDLYEFEVSDIKTLLNDLKLKSRETLETACVMFTNYYDWYWIDYMNVDVSGTENPFNEEIVKPIIQRIYLKAL